MIIYDEYNFDNTAYKTNTFPHSLSHTHTYEEADQL